MFDFTILTPHYNSIEDLAKVHLVLSYITTYLHYNLQVLFKFRKGGQIEQCEYDAPPGPPLDMANGGVLSC